MTPVYPGLGLPVRQQAEKDSYPIGAHQLCSGATAEPIPVRELAMMSIMNSLTDKPDWHVKVHDEYIVEKWRSKALAVPSQHWWNLATTAMHTDRDENGQVVLRPARRSAPESDDIMTADVFDVCIKELQSKANYFERSGMVPTLDCQATVVKSDKLVSASLHKSLLAAFETLISDQADSQDWHPNSNDMVQDLVHPSMYPLVYGRSRVIQEEVVGVEDAITKWSGRGEIIPKVPKPDENAENWDPSDPQLCADVEVDQSTLNHHGWTDHYLQEDDGGKKALIETKWKALRKPVLPNVCFEDVEYEPKTESRLFDKFRDSGLQIIVKIASIELTPEKPQFPQGGWHVEGQMNEHIACTALYYLESENITTSNLSFRMQTSQDIINDGDNKNFDVGQDSFSWLESVYGTEFRGGSCLQNFGSVETTEKRLLAFPNVFQHRVSPFELADPTRPGHRRFVALWLVDPHLRIISTANVPPQQLSWWTESVITTKTVGGAKRASGTDLPPEIVSLLEEKGAVLPPSVIEGKLPEELMNMIREDVSNDALPMGIGEAKEHRLKLMKERSVHVQKADHEWESCEYNFCEH
ncbi:hypothetical protein E8E13_009270 [Curvularia kusanoi]|uniref:Uncharacterized protein n=1 Tax=Curvularia kusanoi TaxID=90978 RepID=A0A9P4TNT4_CURKU|nr:hypothetical protein E8E13_009270 [Curvularia kusanoi]